MQLPQHCLDRLRAAGLLVSDPFGPDHLSFPDAVCIGKPADIKGNCIPGLKGYWGTEMVLIDAPIAYVHNSGRKWFVSVCQYAPGPGPGDFVTEWHSAEEAVGDVTDYFLGDSSRMEKNIRHEAAGFRPRENDEIQQLVATAKAVLAGDIHVLVGCGLVAYDLVCADLGNEPEYSTLQGIYSECDRLPITPEDRKNWNADALKRKDVEIARLIECHREHALDACRRLVDRYESDNE
jgi:hypothetical protein